MLSKIEVLYRMIRWGKFDKTVHFYHSDVYYVRAALEARTGISFPLKQVESAMIAEGHSFMEPVVDPDEELPVGAFDPGRSAVPPKP